MNQNSKFTKSSGLKRRGIIWLVISALFEDSIRDVMGGELLHMAWVMCTSVKTPLMYTGFGAAYAMEGLAYFSKTMLNHILHMWV